MISSTLLLISERRVGGGGVDVALDVAVIVPLVVDWDAESLLVDMTREDDVDLV